MLTVTSSRWEVERTTSLFLPRLLESCLDTAVTIPVFRKTVIDLSYSTPAHGHTRTASPRDTCKCLRPLASAPTDLLFTDLNVWSDLWNQACVLFGVAKGLLATCELLHTDLGSPAAWRGRFTPHQVFCTYLAVELWVQIFTRAGSKLTRSHYFHHFRGLDRTLIFNIEVAM